MQTKLNLRTLLYFPIIFLFLPAFVFWIPIFNAGYLYFFIVLYIVLFLLLYKHKQAMLLFWGKFLQKTPLKYFILMLILMAINSLFLSITRITSFAQTCHSVIMQLCLFVLPILIYFSFVTVKYISLKSFIKKYLVCFYIMLLCGFIAYIGQFFDIKIINDFFDFFANSRVLKFKAFNLSGTMSNYSAFGLPRLDNFFEEPSLYARFLFFNLPLVYTLGNQNLKYSKNIFFNYILRATLIPFTIIHIVLTLSPMYLIFSIVLTILLYWKSILHIIKKYWYLLFCILILLALILNKIDLSETYISRIINVIQNIDSFEKFILIEKSLANRIINYINSFCVFLQHPLTGVGMGNLAAHLLIQYQNSPVQLTSSIIERANFAITTGNRLPMDFGFIYGFLAENGILIFSVFILFNIKLYHIISKIKANSPQGSFSYNLSNSFLKTLFAISILCFYDYTLTTTELILFYALMCAHIYSFKMSLNKKRI